MINLNKFNKIILILIAGIFVITTSAVMYNIYSEVGKNKEDNLKVQLYFIEQVNYVLKAEERNIKNGDNKEIVSKVLEELVKGPKNQVYRKSIPEGVSILEVTLNGSLANVNLSSGYNELKTSEALFCRAALVYTLTDLEFIDKVKILVDGNEIFKANGEPLGSMKKEDIVMSDNIAPETAQYETIKLYFSNDDGTKLVMEEREVETSSNKELARCIVEQLILGPSKNSKLEATVPSETKINDIKVKDGVCYVDLSTDFVTKHTGGSMAELITIKSIVNSLTEIPEIKKVQFLIDGEKQQEFKGHIDFSQAFERSDD